MSKTSSSIFLRTLNISHNMTLFIISSSRYFRSSSLSSITRFILSFRYALLSNKILGLLFIHHVLISFWAGGMSYNSFLFSHHLIIPNSLLRSIYSRVTGKKPSFKINSCPSSLNSNLMNSNSFPLGLPLVYWYRGLLRG